MRLFTKKQLETIKFASKDEGRQALNGIYVDGDVAVGTDGHRLLMVKSEPVNNEEWPANGIQWSDNDKPFIIPMKTVEKVLRNIPKKADLPILKRVAIGLKEVPAGEADKIVCQTTDLDNTDNVEARAGESKFPEYKQVIPDFKDSGDYQRIGVSAKYLKEVCSVLEKYDTSGQQITLHINRLHSEKTPLIITANDGEGNEATAVIMPMRL